MVPQNKSVCMESHWLYYTHMVESYVRFYAKTNDVGTILFVPKPKFILSLTARLLGCFSSIPAVFVRCRLFVKANVYLFFYSVVSFTSAIHNRIRSTRKHVLIDKLNIIVVVRVTNVFLFLATGYGTRI